MEKRGQTGEGERTYLSESDLKFSNFLNMNSEIQKFQQTANRKNPKEPKTRQVRANCLKTRVKENFTNTGMADILHTSKTK